MQCIEKSFTICFVWLFIFFECLCTNILTVEAHFSCDGTWSWQTGKGKYHTYEKPPKFTGYGGSWEGSKWEQCAQCGLMKGFDPEKCAVLCREEEEANKNEAEEWWGPKKCEFCGAKQNKLVNAHLRIVEGVRIYWKIGDGPWHEEDSPPGSGHPCNRDEDADWFACLTCGRLQGFDAAVCAKLK